MMSDVAIKVENLGKLYRLGLKEEVYDTLAASMWSWVKAPLRNYKRLRSLNTFGIDEEADDLLWAIRNVSFEVKTGEVVGIIGRNGAGKSTLLKVLSRISEPTTGRAIINGRVGSLLEVGTGFHNELSGRDNVYLNGTILGMSKKDIDRKFD
jgi:lipopolysaccharide transport system ATP-binding protein